ncbi:HEAT repeat domain containing protein [Acanthamoeba castellanii str. Neff]|uniref:HEAT repeat domain containing protein n=1 Tax=Acanthamoeba castellanii (strain ATCC 30010 / Neff) TaxID=1257118 RepID=L8GP35_ACACF|nr:HEAT repeat domain containing protein [Acanthamoeba castellanii str. Neff]ELR13906.1 HEAT repeat domain containing protein [Acanthamoeba castellanii str. Neff]
MEGLVVPLMRRVRAHRDRSVAGSSEPEEDAFVLAIFRLLYTLCKVRGYKTVVRFFPHEIIDLEPTFSYIVSHSSLMTSRWQLDDAATNSWDSAGVSDDELGWERRYVLFLWLSIICLIPFNLASFPSRQSSSTSEPRTLIDDLVEEAKKDLKAAAKTRDAAAELLSRLLTRPDLQSQYLERFLAWATEVLTSSDDTFLRTGVLTALAGIFKRGKRDVLLELTPLVLQHSATLMEGTLIQRKLCIKLTQRLGLAFLKPKVAIWRYRRGNRSLLSNLSDKPSGAGSAPANAPASAADLEEDEDYDIPPEMEEIIGLLLDGLRDKDTIVRWSSAKGIGRITERLPKELGDEVVQGVIDLFSFTESDGAWHGGCLAFGELARRGLLLTHRLADIVPLVTKALLYDVKKGSHSIGAHVRDAACYVAWAFARAYEPSVMAPHVVELAPTLIITALFDRAASAAFQENVGRQGSFPFGIDIIKLADYFTLSSRKNAYVTISVELAKVTGKDGIYFRPMVDHLLRVKVSHWDRTLRKLAAKALRGLVPIDPLYFAQTVLPYLVHANLNERHGSLTGVAEVTLGLAELQIFDDSANTQLTESVVSVVPDIEKARLYRGKGGELIRHAVCKLIRAISVSRLPLPPQPLNTQATQAEAAPQPAGRQSIQDIRNRRAAVKSRALIYTESLNDHIKHPNEDIQRAAALAFTAFHQVYTYKTSDEWKDKFVDTYASVLLGDLSGVIASVRRGYALTLGHLPASFLLNQQRVDRVVAALVKASTVEAVSEQRDPESRRNAVHALAKLVDSLSEDEIVRKGKEVFDALLAALDDYSVDNRGDVGSWVREAALKAAEKWALRMAAVTTTQLITAEMSQGLFSRVLRQLAEKIDRLRAHAGDTLERLLYPAEEGLRMPLVPHREQLKQAFPRGGVANWAVSSVTFPLLVPFLRYDAYRDDVLTGLVTSASGSQSLVHDASDALMCFLRDVRNSEEAGLTDGQQPEADAAQRFEASLLRKISSSLVQIFKRHLYTDRITVPLMKTLHTILADGVFSCLRPPRFSWSKNMVILCRAEVSKTNDIPKLVCAARVLCGILAFGDPARTESLKLLTTLLAHKYPRVRQQVAEQLHATFSASGQPDLQPVLALLADTHWDQAMNDVVVARDALRGLLAIGS